MANDAPRILRGNCTLEFDRYPKEGLETWRVSFEVLCDVFQAPDVSDASLINAYETNRDPIHMAAIAIREGGGRPRCLELKDFGIAT